MASLAALVDSLTGRPDGLPGCVLVVANKYGISWTHTSGSQSLSPSSPLAKTPFSLQTGMWIASCTKLLTTICVMQCIENGLLSLDGDLTDILPELKGPRIVTGFAPDGTPLYRPAKKDITMRHLLTHSSGLGNPATDATLIREVKWRGQSTPFGEDMLARISIPLLFEPGTAWSYGVGHDWAGIAVARATHQPLSEYMEEHIAQPLGMTSITFRPQSRPELLACVAEMSLRKSDGSLAPSQTRGFPDDCADDVGGGGLFSTAEDFVKVLVDLLQDESRLLTTQSKAELFRQHLSEPSRTALESTLYHDTVDKNTSKQRNTDFGGNLPAGTSVGYTLAGLLTLEDVPGMRRKGSVTWSGYPNLRWMVDPVKGLAIFYGSQLLPNGDAVTADVFCRFEEAVYGGEIPTLFSGPSLQ